jgi:hypothetical protein
MKAKLANPVATIAQYGRNWMPTVAEKTLVAARMQKGEDQCQEALSVRERHEKATSRSFRKLISYFRHPKKS